MKSLIVCFTVVASFLCISKSFSQEKSTEVVDTTAQIIFEPVPDPEISEIVSNINFARINEDKVSQEFWEGKLNEITKPQIIQGNNSENLFGLFLSK